MSNLDFVVKNGLNVSNGMIIANSSVCNINMPQVTISSNLVVGSATTQNGPFVANNIVTILANTYFGNTVIRGIATANDYISSNASTLVTTNALWNSAAFVSLTDAPSIVVDASTGFNFTVVIAGNRTLANITNPKVGQSGIIEIVQDSTGGRTLSFDTNYHFDSGVAPSIDTTATRVNGLSYFIRSANSVWIGLPFFGVR